LKKIKKIKGNFRNQRKLKFRKISKMKLLESSKGKFDEATNLLKK